MRVETSRRGRVLVAGEDEGVRARGQSPGAARVQKEAAAEEAGRGAGAAMGGRAGGGERRRGPSDWDELRAVAIGAVPTGAVPTMKLLASSLAATSTRN